MLEIEMKAIRLTGYGNHKNLKVEKIPRPQVKKDELLIRVMASPFTRADVHMMSGKPWVSRLFTGLFAPKHKTPGTGFSGIVEQVGEDVQQFSPGDEVFGETTLGFGAMAEYLCIPENTLVFKKPKDLAHQAAACFGDGPLTAWNFLTRLTQIVPGQKVLILGASGSVGSAAVQLARHLGAVVTAVCSEKNHGWVKGIGAHRVIDYRVENPFSETEAYDLVFDAIGVGSFKQTKPCLTPKGIYLTPVFSFAVLCQSLFNKRIRFAATGLNKKELLKQMMMALIDLQQSGGLQLIMDTQYTPESIQDAHRHVAGGHKKGNVVVHF